MRLPGLFALVLLVSCGPDAAPPEAGDEGTQLEGELTGWASLTGVWKKESGPYAWLNLQRAPGVVGHRYLALKGAAAEAGTYQVADATLTLTTGAGAVKAFRFQVTKAGALQLRRADGTLVAQLKRVPTRVSDCVNLVCPAVDVCAAQPTGAHCVASPPKKSASEAINADGVLVLGGKKVFPIGFTMPPPPDALAPNGKNGIAELRSAGATFLRTGPWGAPWNEDAFAAEKRWQDVAFANGMHTWLYLKEAASVPTPGGPAEQLLRRIVTTFGAHPGLGVYKGEDEPEWGQRPVPPMVAAYDLVHALDPHHPLTIIQAPRGTVESLRRYTPAMDILGTDIYPVSAPMGKNSGLPNKELSVVGDYTDRMRQVAGNRIAVWMTLQIAWSGILPPNQRVMPTLHQERFMAYDAIIHGARGLFFFGGHMPVGWEGTDAQYGWSWTFWNRALKPVVKEIGEFSPLYPALVAPDSAQQIRIFGDHHGFEYALREANGATFVIAARTAAGSNSVTFRGVAPGVTRAEVLYEDGRTLGVEGGAFTDTFGQFDVHVYRLR